MLKYCYNWLKKQFSIYEISTCDRKVLKFRIFDRSSLIHIIYQQYMSFIDSFWLISEVCFNPIGILFSTVYFHFGYPSNFTINDVNGSVVSIITNDSRMSGTIIGVQRLNIHYAYWVVWNNSTFVAFTITWIDCIISIDIDDNSIISCIISCRTWCLIEFSTWKTRSIDLKQSICSIVWTSPNMIDISSWRYLLIHRKWLSSLD